MKQFVLVVFALVFSLALSAPPVFSQTQVNLLDPSSQYVNIQNRRPQDYIVALINMSFGAAGVLTFLYLLWGGIQWITAGGDKEGLDKARRKMVQALTGLVIILSAYAIIQILQTIFNVNLRQFNIPTV